jgi:multiple antibiotic resistance protein
MQRAKLIGDAITLLVVIDPISVVPLFLALTRGLPRDRRRRMARRGVVIAAAILLGADAVLRVIGSTEAPVLTRVLGLVLAALATQTMLDGLHPFLAPVR